LYLQRILEKENLMSDFSNNLRVPCPYCRNRAYNLNQANKMLQTLHKRESMRCRVVLTPTKSRPKGHVYSLQY
jgi:hypothetical protein